MHWNIQSTITSKDPKARQAEIIQNLLRNRGLTTKSKIDAFLHPPHPRDLTLKQLGLSSTSIKKATTRIQQAIAAKQTIYIYGDYDADGITATAILWETLHSLGAKAIPFIPHRQHHGYGLSIKGIKDILSQVKPDLIVTVDNGIVAHDAAKFIHDQDIDLIITDHHQPAKTKPQALAIIHSDQISGAGVAWYLSIQLAKTLKSTHHANLISTSSLDLLAVGTIADMMPMIGVNRSIAKYGLDALTQSKRPGIAALKQVSGIDPATALSGYHVGFNLGPRINAMGRLEHGLDALRLLCTKDQKNATKLAKYLDSTNKTRQDLTFQMLELADQIYQKEFSKENIIVVDHPDFHEGVIGLIAGRLTEKYSKPSIIISRGEKVSKASARSPSGINIIKLIRTHQDLLLGAGGHPGAAGLSLETQNISKFRSQIIDSASQIDISLLQPSLDVDCDVKLSDINLDLYSQIQQFAPFGILNPRPVFSSAVNIIDLHVIGRQSNHLKLVVDSKEQNNPIDALFWQRANDYSHLGLGDKIRTAFTIDLNEWNGKTNIQLILKNLNTLQ